MDEYKEKWRKERNEERDKTKERMKTEKWKNKRQEEKE